MKIEWRQASGLCAGFSDYWRIYGGWAGMLASPYFLLSIGFCALTYQFWLSPGWWEIPLQVMPNVLSFSLGGFAILLAFGDEKFRARIAGKLEDETEESPYLQVTASFMHFILLQVLSLAAALLAKAWAFTPLPNFLYFARSWIEGAAPFFWGFGFFVFVYSLFAAIAAVMAIFVVVQSFDDYQSEVHQKSRKLECQFLKEASSEKGIVRKLYVDIDFSSKLKLLESLERKGYVRRDPVRCELNATGDTTSFAAFITPPGKERLDQMQPGN